MLFNSTELREVGEKHIAEILATLGYSCHQEFGKPGFAEIMAIGQTMLLVHVMTSLYPAAPAELAGDEIREVAARAARIGCQAWFAKLRLNSIGTPVGEIVWGRIGN